MGAYIPLFFFQYREKEMIGMDMEICECVGICETDDKGNIIKIEREYFQQGWIFKDWEAFRDSMDAPCYVPELDNIVYTKRDFLVLCNNQEEIAEELFEQLDWQSPSTLFNEWEDMGEIEACEGCGKLLLVFGLERCPYCGNGITKG